MLLAEHQTGTAYISGIATSPEPYPTETGSVPWLEDFTKSPQDKTQTLQRAAC